MIKPTVLNRMKGRKRDLLTGACWLGTNKDRDMINSSIKLNNDKLEENLTHGTIEYNICSRIPSNHEHTHDKEKTILKFTLLVQTK